MVMPNSLRVLSPQPAWAGSRLVSKEEPVLAVTQASTTLCIREPGAATFKNKKRRQEEIWKTSLEEVLQLKQRFPRLAKYMGAPCWVRKEADVKPFCPEGDHFCGVTV
jgi:hypothetical protein